MALEKAGVELTAKNFDEYVKNLTTIEKKQREVFDAKFKGTGVTFAKFQKAARDYEAQLKRAAKEAQKAKDKLKQLEEQAKKTAESQRLLNRAMQVFSGTITAAIIGRVARFSLEMAKLGAQFETQQIGLNNLAASFGQSGNAIQQAIVTASKGTLSNLAAINVANEALLLGVARTPKEFDRFTRAALTLGRTVGLSATESITRFTTALGRESLLRLDDFGAKASEVNAEIERLALAELGKLPDQLTRAEKSAIFIEAALNVTGASVEKIGEDAGEAAANFARMEASSENLKTQTGLLFKDLNESLGVTAGIANIFNSITAGIRGFRASIGAGDIRDEIAGVEESLRSLQKQRERLAVRGAPLTTKLLEFIGVDAEEDFFLKDLDQTIAELQAELDRLNTQAVAEDMERIGDATAIVNDEIEEVTINFKAFQQAVRQAEDLALSFTREQEDALRKIARQQEDVTRRQNRQINKLNEKQAKDRDKLLISQQKKLDNFEENRVDRIKDAEKDIRKEQKKAVEDRLRDQQKLFRELRQAQERFNLSQVQSERRFQLEDRRLRAEGDILALQQLRENRELERLEEGENFNLSQRQTKEDNRERQGEQDKDRRERLKELDDRLKDLKDSFEEQRAELLTGFDEQLAEQKQAQIEQREQLRRSFEEQAEDRKIALAREEEDRRISQQRQLEDLGRSLADQKDVTQEGVETIANEFEKIFGQEGVADQIIGGFSERTTSEFKELFDNIEEVISGSGVTSIPKLPVIFKDTPKPKLPIIFKDTPGFDDGGIVPGPIGSPQRVIAHGGETILPTHKQSYVMPAPIVPTQSLKVQMSGGFGITGADQVGETVIEAAVEEMTEAVRIATERLVRRNG